MKKLTTLLASIQQNEVNKFDEYLSSPYFNKSELAIRFFSYIKENFSSFRNDTYNSEELFARIYPGETYNDDKLKKITSNFIKLIKRFLIAREADKDFASEGFLLLKAYSRRNIGKSFESSFKTLMNYEVNMAKDLKYYFYKINVEDENLNHNFHKTNKDLTKSVSGILNNVNYFFIASKLKYTINTLVLSLIVDDSIHYDIWLKEQILEYIKENDEFFRTEHKEIYTYYLLLLSFLNPESENNYERFINYFKKVKKNLKKESLESIYIQILCYNFLRKSENQERSAELINLIKEIVEDEIFADAAIIHHHIFINIIIELLENKNRELAVKFFRKYRKKIVNNYREMTTELAEAYIAFYDRKIEKCLNLLVGITYDDFFYYLLTKSLYMQIFYDTKRFKMIEPLLDSMRQYVKRNTYIPKYYRSEYEIFLKTMNTLLKLNYRYNFNKMEELRNFLTSSIFVPRRHWFQQKLNNIESYDMLRIHTKRAKQKDQA